MKSIMEEASSIGKAIEKAWSRAQNPKEFSVKILEEPQTNFIGLTVKSAKIALFFNDVQPSTSKPPQSKYPKAEPLQQAKAIKPEQIKEPVKKEIKPVPKKEIVAIEIPKEPVEKENREIWPIELVNSVKSDLAEVLNILNLQHLEYDIKPDNFHLKIKFTTPVFEDKNKEHSFFVSLSTLLLQVLKHKNRRPFKGYKIVLIS